MSNTPKQAIRLFYCYAREDKELRNQFERALSGLKRYYHLSNWYDREILAGQDWEEAIAEQLNNANVIFLLISPDFMASDYCYGIEMKRALERHGEGSCLVIPVLLRPTHWKGAPFGTLELLPTDARPITRWPNLDDAFEDVVKEVSRSIEDLLASLKTKQDWLDEGISSRHLKHYQEALAAFEQALLLDPNYLEAYQEKGTTLYALKWYEEALSTFEHALHFNPNLASLSVAKGQTLNALERHEEALTAFEQAIHLDPSIVDAYLGRDRTLQRLGITREAQERLKGQLQEAQQQLIGLQKQYEQLDKNLKEARQQVSTQEKQLKEFESLLQETRQQRDNALEKLATTEKTQAQIENQLKQTRKQLLAADQRSVQARIEESIRIINSSGLSMSSLDLSRGIARVNVGSSIGIQLNITNKQINQWYFTQYGLESFQYPSSVRIILTQGAMGNPDISISLAGTDWLSIVEGNETPKWGRINIEGNQNTARKFLQTLQGSVNLSSEDILPSTN